jgi:uncharacterized membrane protein YhaH (DUF805 family)
MRWIVRPWRQFFDFSGRATRREYWLFQLQLIILYVGMLLAVGALGERFPSDTTSMAVGLAAIPAVLFYFIGSLSSGVRRIHDHDKSGWLFLLSFIPLVGWIFFLIMGLTPGTSGDNSYGRDPREGDQLSPDEVAAIFS